jgi:hypothetical protein
MKTLLIFACLSFGLPLVCFADHVDGIPHHDLTRIFEIFSWRYTDALELTQDEGDSLKTFLLSHMNEKHKMLQEKRKLLKKLAHAEKHKKKFDTKDANQTLAQYETLIQKLGKHDALELEAIKKIMSPPNVLRYLSLKRELTEMLMKY